MKNNSNKILIAMLAASCLTGGGAQARRLMPDSPSVEIRLEALRILQISVQNSPAIADKGAVTPFKPAEKYVQPTPPVIAEIAEKPVMVAPKPKVEPKPVVLLEPVTVAPVVKPIIKKEVVKEPVVKKEVAKKKVIEKPAPVALSPVIEPLQEIIEPKIEASKVETPKVELPRIEKSEPKKDSIPLPLEIIEESPKNPAQTIGEELSLDELLKEDEPKDVVIEKIEPKKDTQKEKKPKKDDVKLALPEPEIPELEPDFDDMAKIEELPKNLDELENIEPLEPELPPIIAELPPIIKEEPKIEVVAPPVVAPPVVAKPVIAKTEEKPFDDLPIAELPAKIAPDLPLKQPEIKEEPKLKTSPEKLEKAENKKGILPNLSGGFASFLGKPKAEKPVATTKIADGLPELPTFKEAEPPVDAPLPIPDFADEKTVPITKDLPALPIFDEGQVTKPNDAPLPTLPFGETEKKIASLPNDKPLINEPTQNKSQQAIKGNALTVVFSQSETEVPLASQQPLIVLAKQLVADDAKNIKIIAYASGSTDQVSVARRISLARALAVRAFLIDLGVPNTSISVKAKGNDIPSGSPERADITVN